MKIFHSLPVPACILRPDNSIDAYNESASFLGFTTGETVLTDVVQPRNGESCSSFLQALRKGEKKRFCCQLHDSKQQPIAVDIEGALLPDDRLLLLLHQDKNELAWRTLILEKQNENNPAGILVVDQNMNMISYNREFVAMWNVPEHIQKSRSDKECLQTVLDQLEDPDAFLARVMHLYKHPEETSKDEICLKDGRCFLRHSYPLHNAGDYLGRVWYFLDITELKNTQLRLDSQQKFLETMLESVQDGIVACDAAGNLNLCNQAAQEMHGQDCDDIKREQWSEHRGLFYSDGVTPIRAEKLPLARALKGETITREEMVITSTKGKISHVRVSGQSMQDNAGNIIGAVVSLHDVTDLKNFREQLYQMAHHDHLTGLANRRLFHDLLEQSLRRAQREKYGVAVLFLDLDNFKSVNDRYGHDRGDLLLISLALLIRKCLRESDLLCRWGGDEFVITLPKIKKQQDATMVAEKICRSVADHINHNLDRVQVTVSIGIALAPKHGNVPDQLVRIADIAMYQAKKAGKNRYHIGNGIVE